MDPNIREPSSATKAPRPKVRAGSSEKHAGSSSQLAELRDLRSSKAASAHHHLAGAASTCRERYRITVEPPPGCGIVLAVTFGRVPASCRANKGSDLAK